MSTYSEKFKDPRWQKKRLEILNRDKFKCRKCGDEKSTLHIHHILYKYGNDPWDYSNKNLITLCKDCHSVISDIKLSNDEFKVCKISKLSSDDKKNKVLLLSYSEKIHFVATYNGMQKYGCFLRPSIFKEIKEIMNHSIKLSNNE